MAMNAGGGKNKSNPWEIQKSFRDPVLEYIEIPSVYVENLIDTYDMQRIKDVAQSGLRSVFNAATHDRFSHSLGVYHLGKKAWKSLRMNIERVLDEESFTLKSGETVKISKFQDGKFIKELKPKLKDWENLFQMACLLHDIGHPAMSHTLEFLFDEIYTDLTRGEYDQAVTISREEYERFCRIREQWNDDKITARGLTLFQRELCKMLYDGKIPDKISGNPHERMSAYYILMGVERDGSSFAIADNSLAARIKELICSYNTFYELDQPEDEEYYVRCLRFMCRMIIGEAYPTEIYTDADIPEAFENSVKNCIIALLNGKIDADSLDYIARNSYSAGYDTNKVDVNRLCGAFSVRLRRNVLKPVFEKNALSVLEGFIGARNYEPSWLYSHHKIVYSIDVLYKCMYRCAVDILYRRDVDRWAEILLEEVKKDPFYPTLEGLEPYRPELSEDEVQQVLEPGREQQETLNRICYNLKMRSLAKDLEAPLLLAEKLLSHQFDEEFFALVKDEETQQVLTEEEQGILSDCDSNPSHQGLTVVALNILCRQTGELLESEIREVIGRAKRYLTRQIDRMKAGKPMECMDACRKFLEKLLARQSELLDIKSLYFSYILSPCRPFIAGGELFYRSNDSDIDALFKRLYYDIKRKDELKLNEWEQVYRELAQEYFERSYKRSLWKSYQEYLIFLEDIAKQSGLERSLVHQYFLELIQEGGGSIIFHNDRQDCANSDFASQKIYRLPEDTGGSKTAERNPRAVEFTRVFGALENKNFVIRIHQERYKDFSESIQVVFGEQIIPLGRIVPLAKKENVVFPYIFIKEKDKRNMGACRERLKEALAAYCAKRFDEGTRYAEESDWMSESTNGKIFRDVIHGDIEIPRKYLSLIETKAFQRLRRIKQLSTADYVFPNAVHTRFGHSIGTFYVMGLLIRRFEEIFKQLNVQYSEAEIEALRVAALLHDIGHGPYSHNFERLPGTMKTHEEWTIEIIEKDAEIQKAIRDNFPYRDFTKMVTSYIADTGERTTLSFHGIFKALISSQLDADRFDYLLRDSYNTGIGYGKIDISAIIHGMTVTEYRNKFYVCISENVLSYVEQYLFGRYKMYDSVYHSGYKVFSEGLVLKILEYVRKKPELVQDSGEANLKALLENNLSLEEYLNLDDTYINGLFSRWQEIDKRPMDPEEDSMLVVKRGLLAEMCRCLLNRRGYERIYVMNQKSGDIYSFRQELERLFARYAPGFETRLDTLNSFIFDKREFRAYRYVQVEKEKEKNYGAKLWVLTNDGILKDFAQVSPIFSAEAGTERWSAYRSYIYYNEALLRKELDDLECGQKPVGPENRSRLLEEIRQLIQNTNLRQHIEIEEKYSCSKSDIERIKSSLENPKGSFDSYRIEKNAVYPVEQRDRYYDTDDLLLAKNNCSLRCRIKGNRYVFTIKKPTPKDAFDAESQFARFEYKLETDSAELTDAFSFIEANLREIFDGGQIVLTRETINDILKNTLEVENQRYKYYVSDGSGKGTFRFSVCLDQVLFKHGGESREDYQTEVELESDYVHRVSMKFFTRIIEQLMEGGHVHEKDSKYKKGLKTFGLL